MLKKARVKRIEGTHWALSLNLGINGTGSGVYIIAPNLISLYNNFPVEMEKINIFRGVNNYEAFLLQICLTIFSESCEISAKLFINVVFF